MRVTVAWSQGGEMGWRFGWCLGIDYLSPSNRSEFPSTALEIGGLIDGKTFTPPQFFSDSSN